MRTRAIAISATVLTVLTTGIAVANWPEALGLPPVTVDQDKRLSADFVNAPASEVFAWLKKAGVNFVAESSQLQKNQRLTLHLKSQPSDKAIEAIADALGMSWTKKGEIYSLKGNDYAWGYGDAKDSKGKALERMFQEPKELKEWAEKFERDGSSVFKTYSPKDAKDWEMMEKEWVEKFKDLPLNKHDWKVGPMVKEYKFMGPGGKLKDLDKKELEKMFKEVPELKTRLKDFEGFKSLNPELLSKVKVGFGDFGKLMDSLTPDQLEKHKSQGFLTPDDLTAEQKKYLGDWAKDAKISIHFEKDGKTLVIKSK